MKVTHFLAISGIVIACVPFALFLLGIFVVTVALGIALLLLLSVFDLASELVG